MGDSNSNLYFCEIEREKKKGEDQDLVAILSNKLKRTIDYYF